MDIFEIKKALESLVILVDTREQNTEKARKRLANMGHPYERRKLDFGDYSAKCTIENREVDFSASLAVERKMNIDELCNCYCHSRERFERELERAEANNAKVYLLIENGSWEHIYNGKYKSRMHPEALKASILAWLARYNCQIIFCKAETSGKLIGDILYREIKERLEDGINEI